MRLSLKPSPRFTLHLSVFVGLLALGGCGPAADADAEPGADAGMAAAEATEGAASGGEALSCLLFGATPEEAAERPSPLGETDFSLGDNVGKLCYGRPFANERVVMGELVPFGQPWRMGANEATGLHLAFRANIGGLVLEPGSYSIFAIPGEEAWEFVVNSNAARWGIPIDDEIRADDIDSFIIPVGATRSMVEQFTVGWHAHGDSEGHLVVDWERTRVEIPVSPAGG